MAFYKSTIATYESTCTKCDEKIKIHSNIKYDYNGGNWRHLVCPKDKKEDVTMAEHLCELEKKFERPTDVPAGENTNQDSYKYTSEEEEEDADITSLWEAFICHCQ
tara:strand:- start:747 stop:1064 length:318 start_codon:yes stop_codon:yes gene_type:complete